MCLSKATHDITKHESYSGENLELLLEGEV